MLSFILATAFGLLALWWTAERFVEGAVGLAVHWRMPPLLIGMLIMGFGTSAPELVVSLSAALDGSSALALGNAFGSNIANIGLILGLTAVLSPIAVQSQILRRELPVLLVVTVGLVWLMHDGALSRAESVCLLVVLLGLVGWSVWQARMGPDHLTEDVNLEMAQMASGGMSPLRSGIQVGYGLLGLIGSAQLLIWGGVGLAQAWGVSETVIGLTVVAVGTSLPELAASVAAVRKGEHDLAFGNVLGSNLFNTLGVVGVAGAVASIQIDPVLLQREVWVLLALTASLFIIGYGWRKPMGRVNRVEGALLLVAYAVYVSVLVP